MGAKGQPKTGGRKKGSQNEMTVNIKDAIHQALNQLGPTKWMLSLAETDPKTFAMLVAKCIPAELKAELDVTNRYTMILRDLAGPSDDKLPPPVLTIDSEVVTAAPGPARPDDQPIIDAAINDILGDDDGRL